MTEKGKQISLAIGLLLAQLESRDSVEMIAMLAVSWLAIDHASDDQTDVFLIKLGQKVRERLPGVREVTAAFETGSRLQ